MPRVHKEYLTAQKLFTGKSHSVVLNIQKEYLCASIVQLDTLFPFLCTLANAVRGNTAHQAIY